MCGLGRGFMVWTTLGGGEMRVDSGSLANGHLLQNLDAKKQSCSLRLSQSLGLLSVSLTPLSHTINYVLICMRLVYFAGQ